MYDAVECLFSVSNHINYLARPSIDSSDLSCKEEFPQFILDVFNTVFNL